MRDFLTIDFDEDDLNMKVLDGGLGNWELQYQGDYCYVLSGYRKKQELVIVIRIADISNVSITLVSTTEGIFTEAANFNCCENDGIADVINELLLEVPYV